MFRDQYVVALVGGGGNDNASNVAVGMAAMAGVVRNIKQSGLSRRDVDKMYAETIELVYRGEEEGVGVDANQGTG